ncbi:MAG: plasma-membrane proton-efflux P-type ATPase [Anaerolineales bacterium]
MTEDTAPAPHKSSTGRKLEDISLEELKQELDASLDGLSTSDAQRRLDLYGPNQIEDKQVNPILKFLSYFWGPIPWMIEVAAVLSAIVGHWEDLIIICILLVFNAIIGFWQEYQAANAVDALKQQLARKARVRRDGAWLEIEASDLVPGDVVRLRLGDLVPADVKLAQGDYLRIDESALTGESLPVEKQVDDVAFSGSVVQQGEMVALVGATGGDTSFAQTAKLVASAKSASHFQKAVLTIGDYLIYISIFLAVALTLVMILRGETILTIVQFALILVVAAIPVALPAVLSMTMAIGARSLTKYKAIVTRLESIEEMAGIDILCSDKTGTLTQNKLTLSEPALFAAKDAQELILAGALASKEENRDAIDMAVLDGLENQGQLSDYEQADFVPFDPVRKRTEATIKAPDGTLFKVTKGAPQVVIDMCGLDSEWRERANAKVEEYAEEGHRTLGVARTEGDAWQFLGILPLHDPPREDSAETIKHAQDHGIRVKMVTGDNIAIAKSISAQLGLGSTIYSADAMYDSGEESESLSDNAVKQVEDADGFAQVYPEHKFKIVKALQDKGHIVGMTGDGVNDAPALKQADTGVAVSGATDAARSASDLVLTAPGISVIVNAVEEARKIFERMNSYAIYRITETIRIMFFVVLAMTIFNFYPITTIMIILLALLNDLPIMTIAFDNTWLDPEPIRWNMRRVLTLATTLGLIGVVQTFGVLVIGKLFLHLNQPQIQSLIYLKLAVAGHLTLFITRTKHAFYSRPYPARILLVAVLATQAVAAAIVGFGILVTPIPWLYVGLIWVYCLIWMFINDWAKLRVYEHLDLGGPHHRTFLGRLQESFLPSGGD